MALSALIIKTYIGATQYNAVQRTSSFDSKASALNYKYGLYGELNDDIEFYMDY